MVLEEIRIGVSLGVFGIVLFCFLGVSNFFLIGAICVQLLK